MPSQLQNSNPIFSRLLGVIMLSHPILLRPHDLMYFLVKAVTTIVALPFELARNLLYLPLQLVFERFYDIGNADGSSYLSPGIKVREDVIYRSIMSL